MTIRDIHTAISALIRETDNKRAQALLADAQEKLTLAALALVPEKQRKRIPRDGDEEEPEQPPERVPLKGANASDAWYVNGNVQIRDGILTGGYRSCIMGWQFTKETHTLNLRNVELRQGPGQRGIDPVYGTAFAIRDYGVAGGLLEGVDCHNFFSSKDEGHVTYLDLSVKGILEYRNCAFSWTGGHGIYHTHRAGHGPDPDPDGVVRITDCRLLNTDIDPGRGAYSISLPDAVVEHVISGCEIVQDAPEGTYLKNGRPVGCRGLLMAEGRMNTLTLHDTLFRAVGQSDRYAQVWIEGPEAVAFHNCRFDCERVCVNHPYGDNADTIKTKRLTLKDCVGPAELVWNGEVVGTVDSVRSGEWRP